MLSGTTLQGALKLAVALGRDLRDSGASSSVLVVQHDRTCLIAIFVSILRQILRRARHLCSSALTTRTNVGADCRWHHSSNGSERRFAKDVWYHALSPRPYSHPPLRLYSSAITGRPSQLSSTSVVDVRAYRRCSTRYCQVQNRSDFWIDGEYCWIRCYGSEQCCCVVWRSYAFDGSSCRPHSESDVDDAVRLLWYAIQFMRRRV